MQGHTACARPRGSTIQSGGIVSSLRSDLVLRLENVGKSFGRTVAVDHLSLEILRGELFTLLGPSGCGKTTTLRIIAGLERPDRGEIFHGDRTMVSVRERIFVPPEERGLGMVFQNHALWPHMTVFENVAYPLRLRRIPSETVRERVRAVLSMTGLEGFEDRPAPLLSGGQQQRVALARALVYEPDILLLDEPFSNLDARLREQMGRELRRLRDQLGITLIYVTHDQAEAIGLSDRIAVMNRGVIEQSGQPQALYEEPQTPFVRDFLGKTVVLRGVVEALEPGRASIALIGAAGTLVVAAAGKALALSVGDRVCVAVRPEDFRILDGVRPVAGNNVLAGTLETVLFVGQRMECTVCLGEERLLVYVPRQSALEPGAAVTLQFPEHLATIWPV